MLVRAIDVATFVPMHFSLGENRPTQLMFQRAASDFSRYALPTRGHYAALLNPYETLKITAPGVGGSEKKG